MTEVPGIDLDELAMQLHDAFFATEHSGLMGMDLWRSVAQRLPLLAEARALRDREARVRELAAKWIALGGADVYETPVELGEILLGELDGDR